MGSRLETGLRHPAYRVSKIQGRGWAKVLTRGFFSKTASDNFARGIKHTGTDECKLNALSPTFC